jgi:hypothetical protein
MFSLMMETTRRRITVISFLNKISMDQPANRVAMRGEASLRPSSVYSLASRPDISRRSERFSAISDICFIILLEGSRLLWELDNFSMRSEN